MPKDILTLKAGTPHAIPPKVPRPIPQPAHPSASRQGERLNPKFQSLHEAMDAKRVALLSAPTGIDPEMVLVFEVVGNVENFIKAAKRIGLEWEGDLDTLTDPDDDFHNIGRDNQPSRSPVSEKLYLTLTNERVLNELLSLWRRYTTNEHQFPKGFAPFKDVFSRLKDIRKWGARERFMDTGVIDEWRQILDSRPEKIKFEIELWFRSSHEKRTEAENAVRAILENHGGSVLKSSVYEQIAYHGLKVECPAEEIRRMVDSMDDEGNELINADQIMWIRATGQMIAKSMEEEGEELDIELKDQPSGDPVIALLDGLPMSNHSLLQDRLIINDAEGYEDLYPVDRRSHATGMSSLIIHGDLNNRLAPLDDKLYVRPIMRPIGNSLEGVPDDKLLVDVIHKAIKEIVDSPDLASTIRIVNLSIGNENRPFFNFLSPEAKMLDWLSQKYNLLFVVSSGNKTQEFFLDITIGELKALSGEALQKMLYDYLWGNSLDMRILSPSESINALTVGALNKDNAQLPPIPATLNPIMDGFPALYSRYGGGVGRSIKPECMNNGGRDLYYHFDIDSMDARLKPVTNWSKNGPGLKVATPWAGLNGTTHSCGTSNAAALTSRLCSDMLKILREIPSLNLPYDYEAIAIKAIVTHSCRWREMGKTMKEKYVPQIPRKMGDETLKVIGYGYPLPGNILCSDQRVTLIGYGSLRQNQQMEFKIPLPPCLISQAVKKRLTITLAWFSPIDPLGKSYRLAKLSFEPENNKNIADRRTDADNYASRRGTVQHEVFEAEHAAVFQDGDELKILVKCKKEEALSVPVKFVIMTTLESAPSARLPIYNEVRIRLRTQISVGNN